MKLRLTVMILMGVIGLADLVLYLTSGVTLFHWLNDMLLIFGSIALSIVVIMVGNEK